MGSNIFADAFGLSCISVPKNYTISFSMDSTPKSTLPNIKSVVYNDPATIVFWEDGSKTVVKCQKEKGDTYSKETGLAMAIAKKAYGNKGNFNDVFTKWLGE